MDEVIRTVLQRAAKLRVPVEQISDRADLFEAGLDSLAMVSVMIAIEDAFGIELPEASLTRETFASIMSLRGAVVRIQGGAAHP